jgi:hypothetical protein
MKKISTLVAVAFAATMLASTASQASGLVIKANYYDRSTGYCYDNWNRPYVCRRPPVVVVPIPGIPLPPVVVIPGRGPWGGHPGHWGHPGRRW